MVLLSKLLNLLAQPLNLVLLLLAAGLVLRVRKPRASRNLLIGSLILLVTIGIQALPEMLLAYLENQSRELPADANLNGYVGLVVLGGAMESGRVSEHHQQPLLNGSAERMTMAVAVWRRNPAMRVVFTGGEGLMFGSGPSEAARAQLFFESMGLPKEVLTLESRSQNTFENAVFTRDLAGIDARQRWLLVTSAWHMPRSLAVFEKAGWNVTPFPVDFRTGGIAPLTSYSLIDGADMWETALHELIGIAAYQLTGRI